MSAVGNVSRTLGEGFITGFAFALGWIFAFVVIGAVMA